MYGDIQVVAEAASGAEGIEAVLTHRPDVALVDLHMKGLDGISVIRALQSAGSTTRLVMLTVSDSSFDVMEALKAGASGYLLKSLDSTEFVAMLEGVQRGESAMQRQTMSRLLDSLSDFSREATIELTVRELELLKWVAQGYSNKAIAQEMSISPNTVKYHMKSVLQKLGVQNRAEAVATAIRAGWLPEQPAAKV